MKKHAAKAVSLALTLLMLIALVFFKMKYVLTDEKMKSIAKELKG